MKKKDVITKIRIRGTLYEKDQLKVAFVMLLPMLLATILLFALPVFQVFENGFTNFNLTTGNKAFNGISNYKFIFSDVKFGKACKNTFTFAFFKLLIETTLALAIAFLLDSKIPFRKGFRAIFFVPVVVPLVASSLIWIWFYDPGLGPFNQILSVLGLPKCYWIYHEDTALMSIIIFSIWKGIGYNIMLFLAGLQSIPDSYVEAAKVDGATSLQVMFRIKIPLLRPIISFVVMIGIINTFKVFAEVNVMTPKGGPLYSTALLVNYIYDQAFTGGKMGRACSASVVLFIIILGLTLIQKQLDTKKTVDLG
ncbi:MAG: sugar ABC transporter permease [Sphaerochaetaceae bacterium]